MLRPVLPAVRPFRSGAICVFVAATLGLVGGHAGHRPGRRAPGLVGPDVGQDPRRHGGGGLRLGRDDLRGHDRRAHPHRLPLHRGRAAADRRVGRGRDQGHDGLGLLDHARDARARRPSAAPRRAARRPGDARALHAGARRAARRCSARRPSSRRPKPKRAAEEEGREAGRGRFFWSGDERFPDLYGGDPLAEPEPEPRRARAGARARRPSSSDSPRTRSRTRTGVTRGPVRARRARAAHAAGPLPQRGHRLARLRLAASGRGQAHPLHRGGRAAGHRRPGEGRRAADRGARALQHRGARDRHGRRPAHHALRAAAGARHQGRQGRAAQGRPRVRAGRGRHPHPGADPGQAGGRHRGPERAPPDRPPGRRLPGAAAGLVAADGVAGQGRRGPLDRRRPGEDAAPAGRGHHRRGQVGRDQRDAVLDPAAGHAARGADGARGPQAGRAHALRLDPAPADAGDHLAQAGRDRAAEPRARDGAALRATWRWPARGR